MPPIVWSLLFVIVSTVVSLVGLSLVRRMGAIQRMETHHEVAGFLIGIVGVIYAVLLAFVVVIVWERYHDASRNLAQEANQVGDLWQMAGGFRAEVREPLREKLRTYGRTVVDTEFTTMRGKKASPEATAAFAHVWEVYSEVDPHSETEKALYAESLATMNILSDARRTRLHDADDHMPYIVWAALFGGAAITVAFTFLFQLKSYAIQLVMTGAVVALIAASLFLVIAFARPFGGVLPLSSEPFVDQLARMTP